MAHFPKPFFRTSLGLWYVQVRGKQINLGADRESAFRAYHDLMRTSPDQSPSPPSSGIAVVEVLDAFLDWCQKNKAYRTFEWYQEYLQSFIHSLGGEMVVTALKPLHVQQWLDAHPTWVTGRRGAIIAVQRAMNWAARIRHITDNPIRYMEKPAQGRREQIITASEHKRMLETTTDECFRDLLITCWEVGPRPQEVSSVQADYFDRPAGRWIFPIQESKGKKFQRVIYLTDTALEITERLCARWAQPTIVKCIVLEPSQLLCTSSFECVQKS